MNAKVPLLPISLKVHLKYFLVLFLVLKSRVTMLTLALKGNRAELIRPETLSWEIIDRSESVSVSHSVSMSV